MPCHVHNVVRSRPFNCSESTDRKLIRRMSTGGLAAKWQVYLVALACTAFGRLLIDALSHLRPSFIPSLPSLQTIMSAGPSTSISTGTSQSNFVSIFNAALEAYKCKTKRDLASHPLLPTLQSCDSPDAILAVLREQIPAFSQSQNGDDALTKWVTPTVNVLYAFSSTLGQGVGLVNIDTFPREEILL